MTVREKEKIDELERDVKKMQKEMKETFAEFEPPKNPLKRLKKFFAKKKAK